MIKEGLLGTRRYLSQGGVVRGILGALYGYQEERGDQGEDRGGGGRYRKLTAKEGGPLLGLLLTIDSCFNKLVMHIIRGHCS